MNLIHHTPSLTEYPYSLWRLRKDNPNVSFPDNPTAADIAPFNAYWVTLTPQPEVDLRTHRVDEAPLPTRRSDGSWEQAWVVRDATPEEASAYDAANAPQPDWDTFESIILQSPELKAFVAFAATKDPLTAGAFPAAFFEAKRGSYNSFQVTWSELVRISPVEINVAESVIAVAKGCHLPEAFIQIVEDTVSRIIDGTLETVKYPDWETFESMVLQSTQVKDFITYASQQNPMIPATFFAAFFEAKRSSYTSFANAWRELTGMAPVDPRVLASIVNVARSCDLPEEFVQILGQ
jgi:hypothetical protein